MNKRLTRSDYLFSLLFILMLVCVLGAFFYGLQTGTNRAEARNQKLLDDKKAASKELTAYHQTYLVSFYHTIYLPYRDFQNQWFKAMREIELQKGSVDPSSLLKELNKLAEERYASIVNQTMPASSPLLKEAHDNYLKSLKLFADGASAYQAKANGMKGGALLTDMSKNNVVAEAKSFALKAQKAYYDSMVKWNVSAAPDLPGIDLVGKDRLSVEDWNTMNLNLKNDYLAGILVSGRQFADFTPQDLAIRVDEMIKSGQAKHLNLNDISKIVDMLTATGAVRQGDFLQGRLKWYTNEPLPLLPFFSTAN